MSVKSFAMSAFSTLVFVLPLQAAVLQLDFGPTAATGMNQANSPYHAASGSTGDTAWNTVQTADVSTGLVYSDGTAVTGVAVNLGRSSSGASTAIVLTDQPGSSNALGQQTIQGVYTGTSVGTDAIFHGGSSTGGRLGLVVTGLAPGTYEIYVTARNTNTAAHSQTIYLGAAAAEDFSTTDGFLSSQTISYTSAQNLTGAWVEDGAVAGNYVRQSVTLAEGQALVVAVSGSDGETRGFLNSVQIVVPEPATAALVAMGASCLIRRPR